MGATAESTRIQIRDQMADQWWRLNNLYWVQDKDGNRVRFKPNWAQVKIFNEMRQNHLVLKARQLGSSMGIQILLLDCALFIDNWNSLTIAHERDALEKMFRRNVKFPYDNLPDAIRAEKAGKINRTHELVFANNSSIGVALSSRSGTVNFLHVSEFGKVCAKYPHKAKEIVTGAFESVPGDGFILVESTAEGQAGYFYDYCQEALKAQQEGRVLAAGDWGITFLPWWLHPEYVASPKGVVITDKLRKYFNELETKIDHKLLPGRRAWYAQKWKRLGDDMKREHPSTPEEAFEASLEGAYYAEQMATIRRKGQICSVPHEPAARVNTWWDLGVDDSTAIWFTQEVGRETHVIDYYEASGEGLQHYVRVLDDKADEGNWLYGEHIGPHDIKVRELGNNAKSRIEVARELGVNFTVCQQHEVADGIEAVRNRLLRCWFDAEKCAQGIKALDSYRKEWDEVRGAWRNKPLHDWSSHGADGFRTGVMGEGRNIRPTAQAVKRGRRIV